MPPRDRKLSPSPSAVSWVSNALGSTKSKAAQALSNKVDHIRDIANEFLEKGDVKSGLKELGRLIRLHQKHHEKCASKKKTPTLSPVYTVMEEYTLVANTEMVLRAATIELQQDIQWLMRESVRYLNITQDVQEKKPNSRLGAVGGSQGKKGGAKAFFVGQVSLHKALKGMVLNNQAVQRWTAGESMPKVIVQLQGALIQSEGMFSGLILHNLAVCFMACGRFDDTTEAITRCLELCHSYLQGVKKPSLRRLLEEEQQAVQESPVSKKGARATGRADGKKGSAPAASVKPAKSVTTARKKKTKKGSGAPQPLTEEQIEAMKHQARLVELRKRWRAYSTLVVTVGTHIIQCHHVIATLAAWCGLEGMEKHHCELAQGCAKKYLPCSHPLQKRCEVRLFNVTSGLLPRVKPYGGAPPQLPLLSQADFIAAPCAAVVKLPDEENPFLPPTVASKSPSLPVSELLSLVEHLRTPAELTEFVRTMATQVKAAANQPSIPRSRSGSVRRGSSSSVKSARSSSRGSPARRGSRARDSKPVPLERLLPPVHKEPPVCPDGPQFITKVPRIPYERYQEAKEKTVQYLVKEGVITEAALSQDVKMSPRQPASTKATGRRMSQYSSGSPMRRRQSLMTEPAKLFRADGTQKEPYALMQAYDLDLSRISILKKDSMPEVRFRAVQMIQRQWRYFYAHLVLERRREAAEAWLRKVQAASTICYSIQQWKERLPAILLARELRKERIKAMHLSKIQSFLREMVSVEEWGRKCAALYQRLLEEKRQREKEAAAATMIQSVWRMHAEKRWLATRQKSALRLQTAWWCYVARKELLARRVHKKLMYEDYLCSVTAQIIYIQRWYRACKSRIAVAGLIEQKKAELEAYLCREEEFFNTEMGDLMDDPYLEIKMKKVMSVLRGAKIRGELAVQWRSRNTINEAITKLVLRRRGVHTLSALAEEKRCRDALRRRREEVRDAAIRIQSLVRQYQAKQRVLRLRECFRLMDEAACRIQGAWTEYKERARRSSSREREALLEEVEAMGKLRTYAATRIQAMWRGSKTRHEQAAFFQFMGSTRHAYAQRIQGAWRRFKAVREGKAVASKVRQERDSAALLGRQINAATIIASLCRMYLVRKTLKDQGRPLFPTEFQRFRAARAIQSAWRCYASRNYVHQMKLATAYEDTEKASSEALHFYATLIQAIVRGKLLNPHRVDEFLHGPQNPPGNGSSGAVKSDSSASGSEVASASPSSTSAERLSGNQAPTDHSLQVSALDHHHSAVSLSR